jgi:hypothetical protein
MAFTLEQRIFILECYIENLSYTDTTELFAQNFPETPQKSSIKCFYDKFKATGSVADVPRSGHPTTVLTEEKITDIQASITVSPSKVVYLWVLRTQLSGKNCTCIPTRSVSCKNYSQMTTSVLRIIVNGSWST